MSKLLSKIKKEGKSVQNDEIGERYKSREFVFGSKANFFLLGEKVAIIGSLLKYFFF